MRYIVRSCLIKIIINNKFLKMGSQNNLNISILVQYSKKKKNT